MSPNQPALSNTSASLPFSEVMAKKPCGGGGLCKFLASKLPGGKKAQAHINMDGSVPAAAPESRAVSLPVAIASVAMFIVSLAFAIGTAVVSRSVAAVRTVQPTSFFTGAMVDPVAAFDLNKRIASRSALFSNLLNQRV
jgi:hypothetical protein